MRNMSLKELEAVSGGEEGVVTKNADGSVTITYPNGDFVVISVVDSDEQNYNDGCYDLWATNS